MQTGRSGTPPVLHPSPTGPAWLETGLDLPGIRERDALQRGHYFFKQILKFVSESLKSCAHRAVRITFLQLHSGERLLSLHLVPHTSALQSQQPAQRSVARWVKRGPSVKTRAPRTAAQRFFSSVCVKRAQRCQETLINH